MHQQTRVSIDPERVQNQIGWERVKERKNMKFTVYLSRAYEVLNRMCLCVCVCVCVGGGFSNTDYK